MLKRLLVLPFLALGILSAGNFHIGIGSLYSSSKATNANIKDTGISLNLGADFLNEKYDRIKYGGEIGIAFGTSKFSGSYFSRLPNFNSSKNTYSGGIDVLLRLGFNISSKEVPLFLNLLAGLDSYAYAWQDDIAFGRTNFKAGIEAQGAFPITETSKLTYNLAYLSVSTSYNFKKADGSDTDLSNVAKPSYEILASIGFDTNLTPKINFYTKAKAKYQNFGESAAVALGTTPNSNINYPASKSVSAMVEVGIGF